jgi:hypothetical protein
MSGRLGGTIDRSSVLSPLSKRRLEKVVGYFKVAPLPLEMFVKHPLDDKPSLVIQSFAVTLGPRPLA